MNKLILHCLDEVTVPGLGSLDLRRKECRAKEIPLHWGGLYLAVLATVRQAYGKCHNIYGEQQ